ncbi:hypothetical protein DESUT3_21120 [Desulfuromonas versatilis]|uniref:Lipoprotein n=1 Tax=Desulfuromonas versatilis TaxID=2802975 RepID=A0ABM8HSV0_9BACT|nr:hypothetical protein [Desulfuromonas versatilis]BCR05043.1 hypothetical protein DESUT3_21120 [Desulfuromonas versatilis]
MRRVAIIVGMLLVVAACATSLPPEKYHEYHAFCRNEARVATFNATPDEESYYRTCMHLKTYPDEPARYIW